MIDEILASRQLKRLFALQVLRMQRLKDGTESLTPKEMIISANLANQIDTADEIFFDNRLANVGELWVDNSKNIDLRAGVSA